MRTVTYGGAITLDGFLAGADGSIDWIHHSQEAQAVMADYWKDVDTILMGRKTYDFGVSMGLDASTGKKLTKGKPVKEPALRTYVFSRTLESVEGQAVELVKEDAVEFVQRLKAKPGKGICLMGGGELAQPLIAAGLVDRIGLNIQPILLGTGVPAFRDFGHRVKLRLEECRVIGGGCVLAIYEVLVGRN